MKVEDLMLGDWVQGFVPDSYSTIYGIFNEQRIAIIAEPSKAYIELSIDDIQPIPLTPKILQKNGFEYLKNCGYEYYDDVVLVRYDTWNERLIIMNDLDVVFDSKDYSSMCVHELQHALRLCGIDKEVVV